MNISDIADGAAVYLDANIFIYHFSRRSAECTRLIDGCKAERFYGITSTITLWEVCHRIMVEEARAKKVLDPWPEKYAFQKLRKRTEEIKKLRECSTAVTQIVEDFNIVVVDVSQEDILRSRQARESYGLLASDSIVVQVLLDYGIQDIATNDGDFKNVDKISVYKPSDL